MHYTMTRVADNEAWTTLRAYFPDGRADEMNVCLFSTSGVHGTYATIEEIEKRLKRKRAAKAGYPLTFLVLQPRRVVVEYGNVSVTTLEEVEWLKQLRASSWAAFATIGQAEPCR